MKSYKMRFCVAGTFHSTWDVEDPVEAYKKLSDWCCKRFSPLRDNDIYVLFEVEGTSERVIQVYQIRKDGERYFIQNTLPNDWWWTDKMKEEYDEN